MMPISLHLTGFATAVAIAATAPAIRAQSVGSADKASIVSLVIPAQANCEVAGPYATIRRANEIANEARRRGYNAVVYHNGDGYYVRAC